MTSRRPGLYVHVPFCVRACPYCDFDFEVGRRPDVDGYFAGLRAELDARGLNRPGSPLSRVDTVYVGGGTPSALGAPGVARLGELLGEIGAAVASTPTGDPDEAPARWGRSERTIELNPEHVDPELLAATREAGFDRVSLGVQTFEADGLRQLGRAHAPEEAHAAVAMCVAEPGLRTSVDLIVGWPGQDLAALERDLERLEALGTDHVSVYALTIEPEVPWNKLVRRGLRVLPDEDGAAALLAAVEQGLRARGFVHYEVASYGRGGDLARHNAKYWSWCDFVGLGPSAASAVFEPDGSVRRRSNVRGFRAWRAAPAAAGHEEHLEAGQAAREGLWTALRRLDGVDLERLEDRFARAPGWADAVLAPLEHIGLVRTWRGGADERMAAVAPDRWLWHDEVAARILGG